MSALEKICISDGEIENVKISDDFISVVLRDWKNVLWEIIFDDPIAYEAISAIGESLSELKIESNCGFLEKCKRISGEGVAILFCYSFISAWSEEPVFRVIARDCRVVQ
jgi:hypothetical protein